MFKRMKENLGKLQVPNTYMVIDGHEVPLKSLKFKISNRDDITDLVIVSYKKRFMNKGPIHVGNTDLVAATSEDGHTHDEDGGHAVAEP